MSKSPALVQAGFRYGSIDEIVESLGLFASLNPSRATDSTQPFRFGFYEFCSKTYNYVLYCKFM